jgi:hypothetical protein
MQHDVLAEYERIYKTYLDKQFVLIYYCGACVFDMVKRLSSYYETIIGQRQTNIQNVYTSEMIEQMKQKNNESVQVEAKPTKAKKSK